VASLSVDRMRPADLDAVLAIERASFSMPSTTISSSARRSRIRHSPRVLPWTISLPTSES